ncbi:hypothetical protein NDU88_002108 [Pleurodeles waltl]|uniref:Uncharacterized protein n=1 Tax=Pleurodeles waltl TaxID=8319 RepID=A0AAV7M514_PLEWA|nr:hypothetical protein NDU88_002108 [Pleurodeles waltl]
MRTCKIVRMRTFSHFRRAIPNSPPVEPRLTPGGCPATDGSCRGIALKTELRLTPGDCPAASARTANRAQTDERRGGEAAGVRMPQRSPFSLQKALLCDILPPAPAAPPARVQTDGRRGDENNGAAGGCHRGEPPGPACLRPPLPLDPDQDPARVLGRCGPLTRLVVLLSQWEHQQPKASRFQGIDGAIFFVGTK